MTKSLQSEFGYKCDHNLARDSDRLKILVWDGDGYALWQKRLEVGTFEFPKVIGKAAGVAISATELSLILGGVALNAKRWPRYAPAEKSSGI